MGIFFRQGRMIVEKSFVLRGDVCYSKGPRALETIEGGYLVCEGGASMGAFALLPERFRALPLVDHAGCLIMPGLIDLHTHAPQFAFRALGMDLTLLDWLNEHTFPEEARYLDPDYARAAYERVVGALRRGATTRACLYATVHREATIRLMDLCEASGLICYVGKVNMDRNAPDALREVSAARSLADTRAWLETVKGRYRNTRPILTPRFIPSCSDELLIGLAALGREFGLPIQSHLSENPAEIEWVKKLCPESASYADAYRRRGLLGPSAIMAHAVWNDEAELQLLKDSGTFIAHCPGSNMNLSSGIAPARRYLDRGVKLGLGTDVAGGFSLSMLRAMSDAVQSSKLRWRLVDEGDAPLGAAEAFYLGTLGGGAFFGKAGSFEAGYEFDAVVLDDRALTAGRALTVAQRLERAIYLSDDGQIVSKYVRGAKLF